MDLTPIMRRSLPRLSTLALLSFGLSAQSLLAQTDWYVDPIAGHDRNSGLSAQDALLHVEDALELAQSGDTVLLLPGQHQAFTLAQDGLTLRGFPTAEVLVGSAAFAIHLDASQAHFSASTSVQDLVLRGAGNDGTGILIDGSGKMSARFLNLRFEALAYGVQWFATGPAPSGFGGTMRSFGSSGGSHGWTGGAATTGKNRLRVEDCVFLGGSGGGGGDLPQVGILWEAGTDRPCEAQVLRCRIEDYPLGMNLKGGKPMSPKLEGNDILRAQSGMQIETAANGSMRSGGLSWGSGEANLRILDNLVTYASGGGGGGDLPPEGLVLHAIGNIPLTGRISGNQIQDFTWGILLSGGSGGGGGDLPQAAVQLHIRNNILLGGGDSGGGGGDLPGTEGIQIMMPAHMPLELEITGNDLTDFLTGVWAQAPFGAGFLVSGNVYTDVTTHESLSDTSP